MATRDNESGECLTVREAAALLRLDRKTVYQLVADDKLPGVRRVGRSIRLFRPALMKWLEDARPEPMVGTS
jgi:excisionase family DNA binding protein